MSSVCHLKGFKLRKIEIKQIAYSLNRRKEERSRAEQERIANIPDPEMPPGHRLLADTERRQTLDKLRQSE